MEIKNKKSKKAQEEVFGFVIIVMIVMVIGVVFFAFSIRRAGDIVEPEKPEIEDLLHTMLAYTTECEIHGSEQNIRALIRRCHNNEFETCNNAENACDVLENHLTDILDQFLGQEISNADIHGYVLNISNENQVAFIEKGTLEGDFFGSSIDIPTLIGNKDIAVRIRLYYSKD